jgi:TnpA family transposase
MPRRVTLTDRQREALLHLPVDQGELLRHYTLSDEDLGHIRQRRRAHNRFGFALQLCVLRYPGRVLAPGELIPAQVSDFIAAQLGLTSDDLLLYAARGDPARASGGPSPNLRLSLLFGAGRTGFARMDRSGSRGGDIE